MINATIDDCWNFIKEKEKHLLVNGRDSLSFFDDHLYHFSLPLLKGLNIQSEELTDFNNVCPSFKNLTNDIIFCLRRNTFAQREMDVVNKWGDKLIRFCEVRYRTLKKRSIAKCGSKVFAQLHILHLACFFMEHFFYAKDLRYLNIVLKLADLKWVIGRNENMSALIENNGNLCSTLLEFRIITMIDYAIEQLQKDMKYE